jgi:hypothetical protein
MKAARAHQPPDKPRPGDADALDQEWVTNFHRGAPPCELRCGGTITDQPKIA